MEGDQRRFRPWVDRAWAGLVVAVVTLVLVLVLSIGDTFGVGIEGLTGPFGLALSAYLGATSVAQARAAHEPVNGPPSAGSSWVSRRGRGRRETRRVVN